MESNNLSQNNNLKRKILYAVPVPKEYVDLWIWYKLDNDIMQDLGYEVIFCRNIKEILFNINKADIVYGWWWARMAIYIIFCKIFRKKLIITGALHMFDLSGGDDFFNASFLKKILSKISLRYADANIFLSRDQYQSVTSHIKTSNPKLVYSSSRHNNDQLNLLRKKKLEWVEKNYNFNNGITEGLKICTICWHTKQSQIRKGLILLINSYLILKKNNLSLPKLTIMGKEGNGIEQLESFIINNELEDFINLKINISIPEKDNIFLNSHFYVQSSWYEGFGNAVLEAMEQGTPALVSRYSAQPEVVGEAGIINIDQSPEGLMNEIKKLYLIDKQKYIEMINKGYRRIKDLFIYEKRKRELNNIFEDI